MVDATTIIIGIIFILIVLILAVYLVFYNRVVLPTGVIASTGFTLSQNGFFITLESLLPNTSAEINNISELPVLTLQKIPTGEFETGAQQWVFVTSDQLVVQSLGTAAGAASTPSGTNVYLLNAYTSRYVRYVGATTTQPNEIPGSLVADVIDLNGGITSPTLFTLMYNAATPQIISLKSLEPPIKNAAQYIIPGPTITALGIARTATIVTVGPVTTGNNSWTVS